MINKIILYLLLITTSSHCLASPATYGYRSYSSSSSSGAGSSFILLILGILAFFVYYKIFKNWIYRKKNNIQPELGVGLLDNLFMLFIYAFLAMLACCLIFFVLEIYGGRELIRSIGLYVWIVLYAILLFLVIT